MEEMGQAVMGVRVGAEKEEEKSNPVSRLFEAATGSSFISPEASIKSLFGVK